MSESSVCSLCRECTTKHMLQHRTYFEAALSMTSPAFCTSRPNPLKVSHPAVHTSTSEISKGRNKRNISTSSFQRLSCHGNEHSERQESPMSIYALRTLIVNQLRRWANFENYWKLPDFCCPPGALSALSDAQNHGHPETTRWPIIVEQLM